MVGHHAEVLGVGDGIVGRLGGIVWGLLRGRVGWVAVRRGVSVGRVGVGVFRCLARHWLAGHGMGWGRVGIGAWGIGVRGVGHLRVGHGWRDERDVRRVLGGRGGWGGSRGSGSGGGG